jgi:hypothetical protein
MRNELAAAGDRIEKVDSPKPSQNDVQPAAAEAQLLKITEPPSPNLAARVTQLRVKVRRFVGNLFSKSINFVKGE